jgi:hypothetical protein
VSWKHVNFYGQYNFLETTAGIDLSAIVDWLEESNGGGKAANWHFAVLVKNTQSAPYFGSHTGREEPIGTRIGSAQDSGVSDISTCEPSRVNSPNGVIRVTRFGFWI